MTNVETDVTYEFTITDKTLPSYKFTQAIAEWLKNNMVNLSDDHNNKIFSKVNYGYNEETLKGFGKKPVCDVYVNNIGYDSDVYSNTPKTVTSFIICYLKGNMNNAYSKACELTDYIVQEFNENDDFRELVLRETVEEVTTTTGIVRNTFIRDVRLKVIPAGKSYGVLCAFELEHQLY
jgi:predicted RNase H-related nuclease YkuK (DUF458 family)